MDFLTNTNASIDITGRQMTVNGETFYFTDRNSQSLNFRCFTRRSIVIPPSTEVAIPVRAGKRQWKASSAELHLGLRILESSTSCKLKNKGIIVGRTLVDVSDNNTLLISVVSLSTEPQTLDVETVVVVAQTIKEVTTLKTTQSHLEDPSTDSPPTSEIRPGNQLPEPLHELWKRSREHVNHEESSQVAALLLKYQHLFLLSDSD